MSPPPPFPGRILPRAARAAIAETFGEGARLARDGIDPRLFEIGASFVTLSQDGALRGCVGRLEAARPLIDDVEENALAAAFEDRRFSPLPRDELRRTAIEVSVLSPLRPVPAASENELLDALDPGRDGLVLVAGSRRATFLPQVWESLPRRRDFLDQLRRKAGLGAGYWDEEPEFFRYRVHKWDDDPLALGAPGRSGR